MSVNVSIFDETTQALIDGNTEQFDRLFIEQFRVFKLWVANEWVTSDLAVILHEKIKTQMALCQQAQMNVEHFARMMVKFQESG